MGCLHVTEVDSYAFDGGVEGATAVNVDPTGGPGSRADVDGTSYYIHLSSGAEMHK